MLVSFTFFVLRFEMPRMLTSTVPSLRRILPALAIACACAERPAGAQSSAIDASVRRAVVDTVAEQVARMYVDADTGRMIADAVHARYRAGAYDTVGDPFRFAQRLTTDLRSVNGDLHLSVAYVPEAGAGSAGRAPLAFADRSQHYAIGRADVLPGNVGYLELTGFSSEPAAEAVLVAALRYLEPTDAVVLDLRRNRGGAAALVNFLVSHFTGPDIPSLTVKVRDGGRTSTRRTLPTVPGPRRLDVPLYVLTSRATGSAGEDCAFVLQQLGRATLVGDRTAGAGHNVRFVPSGHGFRTGISFSRVSDPRTGKEWERVGVQPDVKVDPATALDVAHGLALQRLAQSASEATRPQLEFLARLVQARQHPPRIAPAMLASYAGEYEGGRRVTVAGDRLVYRIAAGALPDTLVALSDSTFALATQVRLTFVREATGRVHIDALLPDGARQSIARLGPDGSTPASPR